MQSCGFALVWLSVSLAAQTSGDADAYVDLFNGKDLTGWVNVNCAPETFCVRDGVLHCTGKPTGALRTERMFENFELEIEWRHMEKGGNAGIFVWAAPLAAKGAPFLRSIEVQVLDHGYGNTADYTTHGDVFPIWGSTMQPFGEHKGMRSFPSERRSNPSPHWNHYLIVAKDGVLRLSVNGKEVSGGEKCTWRKGYLGLESEGAPTQWRKVRMKELPGGAATPTETADAAQGHRPLYNGVDLRGWTVDDTAKGSFAAHDWRLLMTKDGTAGHALVSDAPFGDFELIADIKLGKDEVDRRIAGIRPGGGILFGTKERNGIVLPFAEGSGLTVDTWHRVVLRRRGATFEGHLDGKPIAALGPPADAASKDQGHLWLVHPGRGVELCNLYVRQLASGD